jgi:hypothetical protein
MHRRRGGKPRGRIRRRGLAPLKWRHGRSYGTRHVRFQLLRPRLLQRRRCLRSIRESDQRRLRECRGKVCPLHRRDLVQYNGRDVPRLRSSNRLSEASIGQPGRGDEQFGVALAAASSALLVGAPNAGGGEGAVFAFSRSGSSYSYVQSISPTGATKAAYGQAIAIDALGETAVIEGTSSGAATAWVFTKAGPNWFGGSAVTAAEAGALAVDAGSFLVGETYAAYAYGLSGGNSFQTLAPSDFVPNSTNGYFGAPLAISGDTAVLGGKPFDGANQLGHFAYVFVKSAGGWVQQAKLVPNDLAANAGPHFKFSLDLDGSTAVLATSFGAYVFARTGTSWTQVQKLPPPSSAAEFGAAVAVSGDAMVIGATTSNGTQENAYFYGRSGGSWALGSTLTVGSNSYGFGSAVTLDHGSVAVGAPLSGTDGAVYVFACQPND